MSALISLPIAPTQEQGRRLKIHKRIKVYKSIIHLSAIAVSYSTVLIIRISYPARAHKYIVTIVVWVYSKCQHYHMGICVWPGIVPFLSALQCAGINTCLTQQIGTNGFTRSAICKLDRWLSHLHHAH